VVNMSEIVETIKCESCGAPVGENDYICAYCGCTFKNRFPIFSSYDYSSSDMSLGNTFGQRRNKYETGNDDM